MTDIVGRLQREADLMCSCYGLLYDAAEEITRLREIARDLLSVMPVLPAAAKHIVGMEDRYNSAITNARAALKEAGHE